MSAGRAVIDNNGAMPFALVNPGDILLLGEAPSSLTTAGAGTLTAAMFATGLTVRSGQSGATNDTTDTAANIISALAGNSVACLLPGTTFRWRYINTVAASVLTLVAGTGVTLDTTTVPNAVTTVAASSMKDFLVTIVNASPSALFSCSTTNGSATVNFVVNGQIGTRNFPPNGSMTVTPGQSVSGTGISAGTTVLGIILGQGGATGVTLSANATATATPASGGVALTFGPSVKITPISGSVAITS